MKRRVFVGRGGIANPATVRLPLAACGVTSDLDIVVPRGLAVFRAGGGRQFFHGGLSPQELVVPVIVADLAKTPEPQKLDVRVQVAGDRITTGVFAATLTFSGTLFPDRLTVRVVAAEPAGKPVARVVSGDGFDPNSGTITVPQGQASVLTFPGHFEPRERGQRRCAGTGCPYRSYPRHFYGGCIRSDLGGGQP